MFHKDVQSLWLKTQGEAERSLLAVMKSYFAGQAKSASIAVLDATIHAATDPLQLAESLLPVVHWTEELKRALRPILGRLMRTGAALNLSIAEEKSYRTKESVLMEVSPSVRDAIQLGIDNALTHLVDSGLWNDVNETTKRDLSFVIQAGFQDGDTVQELARRIEREMGPQWAGNRAMNVAVTESGSALNAGHYQSQKELEAEGIAFGQEWHAIIDNFTREDHVEANGQQIGVGEKFDVGGFEADYPGDPALPAQERCRCRCFATPLLEPVKITVVNRIKNLTNGHVCNGKH
jgi:hypothetical protein